jgi:glycosyltransferase involved in cell wall biosynthesis
MVSPGCMDAVMADASTLWIDTLGRDACDPRVATFAARVPAPRGAAPGDGGISVIHTLLAQIHGLRRSPWREAAGRAWDWRSTAIPSRSRGHEVLRDLVGGPAFPRLVRPGERHVGFLLPILAFGGVEKVALNTAAALRRQGWTPHLAVLERDEGTLPCDWQGVFETVSFLGDPGQTAWDGGRAYCGTDLPPWATAGRHGSATGLLGWLDAVVNCHGAAMHGAMGELRRLGVTTVAALHLADRTAWDRAVGHPYLALAFEHAYDLVTTCSEGLADWCHGMGIPEEKILPVPNAPGYPCAPETVARILAARAERDPAQPLRVLFLGRLDRQKGLGELAETMRLCEAGGLAVDWRIVGKAVVDTGTHGGDALPPAVAAALEPPATTAAELDALYAWADVLILPSRFEGLPLTLLEAMRLGVVPVATDVGAVAEAVTAGRTGILLEPGPGLARAAARALGALSADRSALRRIADAAAADAAGRGWDGAVAPLASALARLRARRETPPQAFLAGDPADTIAEVTEAPA